MRTPSGLRSIVLVHLFLAALLAPGRGSALSPIIQFQDLVAGAGNSGFEDGPFYAAQFARPAGLALNLEGTVLYVADRDNNRIRMIDMEDRNRVRTLAGDGQPGFQDGPLAKAMFNSPLGLISLPGGRLLVNDWGNRALRIIDPKAGVVMTWQRGQPIGEVTTQVTPKPFFDEAPWNIVALPGAEVLFATHKVAGTLERLDTKTGAATIVLQGSKELPHPAVLAVAGGKTYLSGLGSSGIFEMQLHGAGISLVSVGQGGNVLALAGNDKDLWALQADARTPLLRVLPKPGPVTFSSVWGQEIRMAAPGTLYPQWNFTAQEPVGFLADPRSPGRLLLSTPQRGVITSYRDLGLADFNYLPGEVLWNSAGIHDFEYPAVKPPHTYRILIVGRSYTFWTVDDRKFEEPGLEAESQRFMRSLAKRLELSLNTLSSLDDAPLHFEVLNGGMHRGISSEINVFSYYMAPGLAEHYDVDLVLLMQDEGFGLDSYFRAPLTKEGIPPETVDPEFLLKKNEDKYRNSPLRNLFEAWHAKGYVGPESDTSWKIFSVDKLMSDPDTRGPLIDLVGKPLGMLGNKLKAMRTSGGEPRRLALCYFPVSPITSKARRSFWGALCEKKDIPYLDLSDDFAALGYTYFPYSQGEGGHFSYDGMFFFSTVLIHELLSHAMIPFGGSEADKKWGSLNH